MNSNLMVMTGVKTPHFGIMVLKVLELEQADKVVTSLKCLETSPIWGKNPGLTCTVQLHFGQQANMVIHQVCFLVEKQGYLVAPMQVNTSISIRLIRQVHSVLIYNAKY
jgi:hypothetical protein